MDVLFCDCHEPAHPLHLGDLHSRSRAEFCLAFFYRWVLRNVPACSVELLYVILDSFRLLIIRLTTYLVRLENEHLGNMDQYRVTREVPLPYSMDDLGRESDGDEDMDEDAATSSRRSWRPRRRARPSVAIEGASMSPNNLEA
jgi:hypothetical protein